MTEMFDFADFYDKVVVDVCKDVTSDRISLVEVGVANGDSALYLAAKMKETGRNFKLYMVDNLDYGGVLQLKNIYENIIKSGLGEHIEVIPFGSLKAAKMFNGSSIDFCFLDSSHEYKETKQSIKNWYDKLLDGGILSGHDFISHDGVNKAVQELLPYTITRKTIDEPTHFQEFEPEPFLQIENTTNGNGIWKVVKNFYFKP